MKESPLIPQIKRLTLEQLAYDIKIHAQIVSYQEDYLDRLRSVLKLKMQIAREKLAERNRVSRHEADPAIRDSRETKTTKKRTSR